MDIIVVIDNENNSKIHRYLMDHKEELESCGFEVILISTKSIDINKININRIACIIINGGHIFESSNRMLRFASQLAHSTVFSSIPKILYLPGDFDTIDKYGERKKVDYTRLKELPLEDRCDDILVEQFSISELLLKIYNVQKRIQHQIYKHQDDENISKILNSSNVLFMVTDYNNKIILSNDLSVRYLNQKPLLGEDFFEVVYRDKEYRESIIEIYNSYIRSLDSFFECESLVSLNDPDQIDQWEEEKERIINWYNRINYTAKKEVKNIVHVGVDITDKIKYLEKEIQRLYTQIDAKVADLNERDTEYKKELELANNIQTAIIPKTFPLVSGTKLEAKYIPVHYIGGDFYDVYYNHFRLKGVIADVCGHGVPAALITFMAKILFNMEMNQNLSPGEILHKINNLSNSILPSNQYLTAFCFEYHPKSKIFRYASGGHLPQFLYREKNNLIADLLPTGPVIGVFPDFKYKEDTLYLEEDDRLILFTDGIIEARNEDQTMFGKERLISFIKAAKRKPAADFIRELENTVFAFAGENYTQPDIDPVDSHVNDDIAIMVLDILSQMEE